MYRPDIKLPLLGYNDPEVSLHWIDSVFDEERNDSAGYWAARVMATWQCAAAALTA